MKSLFTALFMAACVCQAADDQAGRAWLRPPPGNAYAEWVPLPETDVYEVVASKEIVALIRDLPAKPFAALSEDTAKYFTGHYYRAGRGKKPFLLRAVYGQGGTGGYKVSRRGNDLLVSHRSLGHHTAYHKSALVVNLDFTPRRVYIEISMAE